MAYSFASDINITLLNDTSSGNNTEDSKHPQNRHKKFGDIGRTGIVGGAIAGVVVPALVILLGTIYWQCFKDRDDVNIHESGNAELELLPTSNKQPSRKLPQSKNVSTSMFVFCVNQRVRDNSNKQPSRKLPQSKNGEHCDNNESHVELHNSDYDDIDEILPSLMDPDAPSAADGLIIRYRRNVSS
eukprot:CAMPEP_0185280818 /NCGR_PEP_ID=MMETSP1359-20130426/66363_1 /TAXON_ID=552665 /ORGANISM="Bigelowiella longifila, Strain CCMP242" /LENGTH=185 /DNA_ID=CAMNT_0027876161 /DNA_START=265 /DNA_END=822 /DNA_ORIENTATION=+